MKDHKGTGEKQRLRHQLTRYGSVGLLGTAVHYSILAGLLKHSGFGVVLASTYGALAGTVVNYILHYFFTFRSGKDHRVALIKFWVIAQAGWALNAGLLFLNLQLFKAPTIPAQLFATGFIFLSSFQINRRWTF